jgi:hypothetical protein
MTNASVDFRVSLRAFYCGDPSHVESLDITDEVVAEFVQNMPNLEHVRVDGAPRVGILTFHSLMHLEYIVSITLTTTRSQPNSLDHGALGYRAAVLEEDNPPRWVRTYNELRYLELGGQCLEPNTVDRFEHYTSNSRSAVAGKSVEIVCTFGPYHVLWRDGFPSHCKG